MARVLNKGETVVVGLTHYHAVFTPETGRAWAIPVDELNPRIKKWCLSEALQRKDRLCIGVFTRYGTQFLPSTEQPNWFHGTP